ncbi:hydantoinase/oxoprolinase family protein [Nesterenkonia marinintestina]|uniref:hydantoinase/oxoprolinase family protein n=1 Tax=Nesterenkonia marinintestina TaxID=2979865 RepID=UPI0021BF90A9|nr:hydantoinase/oxoprolinase family protein [Nesterenkonia sp. GX14115]
MGDLRVAVDAGGTFTDVCIYDAKTQDIRVTKVPSTPDNPREAVVNGVERGEIDLKDVELFFHGTTVATNALITRRFPKASLVTTEGFRDVIEIRDGTKDNLWDAYKDVTGPYIRRRDRFEVPERVDYAGRVVTPLDESAARALAQKLKRRETTTIAVCFLNSFANADNERRMKEILEEEIPDASVTTSAEVLPEIFEHDRFHTAVANTVLGPLVSKYVEDLDGRLTDDGYTSDLLLLHSGGGSMTPPLAKQFPVRLAASGIAAGAIAAKHIAEQCGLNNAVGLDMGGTSTDISMVNDGELRITNQWEVEYGHPITFPSIEVLTIGAGGGSLAHVDVAGALRNGPESAGAVPGPVCYERGGDQPTNTDANLILRRLGEDLADGALQLNRDDAEKAITEVIGEPLGLSSEQAAQAILRVANANMADAVRLVSIRRGLDPRDFALIAFGGAGALHGAEVAKELGIPTVVVPPNPGVTSAMGCLLVDIQHDLSRMYSAPASEVDVEDLERQYREMEAEAADRLRQEKVADDDIILQRGISMRYFGQWRSLQVTMGHGQEALQQAVETFHEEHERQFAFRQDDNPVEVYQVHLRAVGKTPRPTFTPATASDAPLPEAKHVREVYFDGTWHSTPIFDRAQLHCGVEFDGPAVVEQLDATTLVPPGARATVDEWMNIRMQVARKGDDS